MPHYLKIINVFLLATVKYFYTPLAAFLLKLGLWETMITMISGGIVSFITFYYISKILRIIFRYVLPALRKVIPVRWLNRHKTWKNQRAEKRKHKKIFTRRNKFIVKFRKHYGFWGIIVAMPVIISIPIGAILIRKYFNHRKGSFVYPILAIAVEGAILCLLFYMIPAFRR